MNKIIAIAVLSLATSFAAASDLTLTTAQPTTRIAVAVPAETEASSFEEGVANVGAVFGALFKAPVSMGKALVRGIEKGYTGKSQATVSAPTESLPATQTASDSQPAATVQKQPDVLGFLNPAALVAKFSQRDKSVALAPVEEKSTIASSTNY